MSTACGKLCLADYMSKHSGSGLTSSHHFYSSPKCVSFVVSLLAKLLAIVQTPLKIAPWQDNVIQDVLHLTPLAKAYSKHDLKLLHNALESILRLEKCPETAIIIDALSECRDCNADALLGYLHHISHLPKLKLIVLSRNDLRIKSRWKIVRDKDKIQNGVMLCAKSMTGRCLCYKILVLKFLTGFPKIISSHFWRQNSFLDQLEAAETSENQMEILAQTPPSLFVYFYRLWVKKELALPPKKWKGRLGIFSMNVAACEPLTVDEISHFIALGTARNTVQNYHKLNDPLKTVETLCRSLVVFVERKVEIAHPPMKEYIWQRLAQEKDPILQ